MHLVFQFPIVDCRPLLPKNHGKLRYPEWPNPNINSKPFIRRFGAVKERNAAISNWTGESHYCDSHLAMQYSDLHKQGFDLARYIPTDDNNYLKENHAKGNSQSAIYDSYRRYFSDGYFVGKIEAGFVDNTEKKINVLGIPHGSIDLMHILKHYANLPVKIRKKEVKLYRAGPRLAKSYYEESTGENKNQDNQQDHVVSGEIVIVLTYSVKSGFKLPKHAFEIEEITLPDNYGSLKVFGYKLKHESYTLKVWLIETPDTITFLPRTAKKILRDLRINLMHIHQEKEALRILLSGIKNKEFQLEKNSAEAQIVDKYFKRTSQKLFRKVRFELEQKNLLDFALHSEEAIEPGSFNWLEKDVDYLKDTYIRKNIERLSTGMDKKIILFVCSSPKGKNPINFGKEFKKLKRSLRSGTDRDHFEIEIETSTEKSEFLEILNLYKPHYLHLSMHSSKTEGLYFEDENQDEFPMSVEEFGNKIKTFSKRYHKPILILLSACNSLSHAKAVKKYCKHAIGTQNVFPARAGVLYASKFYSALFENNSTNIPYCHDNGQQAIQYANTPFKNIEDIPVHEIPVLTN